MTNTTDERAEKEYDDAVEELAKVEAEFKKWGKHVCHIGQAMRETPHALRSANAPKVDHSMDIDPPEFFDGSKWPTANQIEQLITDYSEAVRKKNLKRNALPKDAKDRLQPKHR